jgi:hypothetical protein
MALNKDFMRTLRPETRVGRKQGKGGFECYISRQALYNIGSDGVVGPEMVIIEW